MAIGSALRRYIQEARSGMIDLSKAFAQSAEPSHLIESFDRLGAANSADSDAIHITESAVVVLSDLSPFSQVASSLSPPDIADFLNRYYEEMGTIIGKTGGIVEKYIGDGILLLFGDPTEGPSSKTDLGKAIRFSVSAHNMVQRAFQGELHLRTIICFGSLYFGWLGPEAHKELTMVGTPLTELFRLESAVAAPSVALRAEIWRQVPAKARLLFGAWKQTQVSRAFRGVSRTAVDYVILTPP